MSAETGKPSFTEFEDIPAKLNALRGCAESAPEYQRVARFIELINAVDDEMERLRNGVARAAGLERKERFCVPISHRPHLSDLRTEVDLRREVAKQFVRLTRTPAPSKRSKKEPALSETGKLARRIALLHQSGFWSNLHRCQECEAWFLGRRQAVSCSRECRDRKSKRREGFKRVRRMWQLENALIPRIKTRIGKLKGEANRNRRERWKERLSLYQHELAKLRKPPKKGGR